jgi:ADP-L-glycero-D-manno-heptose 6-epimerase
MASVVFHAFSQIAKTGTLKLFRSHRSDFEDGKQLRDFVYVKDIIEMCYFFYINKPQSGIYNAGTGKARTFIDLGNTVFKAMNTPVNIEFIDIPEDIRDKYQYFTEAKMEKIKIQGYTIPFMSIEKGVTDYIRNYLSFEKFL